MSRSPRDDDPSLEGDGRHFFGRPPGDPLHIASEIRIQRYLRAHAQTLVHAHHPLLDAGEVGEIAMRHLRNARRRYLGLGAASYGPPPCAGIAKEYFTALVLESIRDCSQRLVDELIVTLESGVKRRVLRDRERLDVESLILTLRAWISFDPPIEAQRRRVCLLYNLLVPRETGGHSHSGLTSLVMPAQVTEAELRKDLVDLRSRLWPADAGAASAWTARTADRANIEVLRTRLAALERSDYLDVAAPQRRFHDRKSRTRADEPEVALTIRAAGRRLHGDLWSCSKSGLAVGLPAQHWLEPHPDGPLRVDLHTAAGPALRLDGVRAVGVEPSMQLVRLVLDPLATPSEYRSWFGQLVWQVDP